MRDLARTFNILEDVMMSFCAGMCSTENVCMLLDLQRNFMGCDMNSELQIAAQADFLVVFGSQVLNPSSDVSDSEGVKHAGKVSKDERNALLPNDKAIVWEVLPGWNGTEAARSFSALHLS